LQSHTLGVLLQGRFDSYFTETPAIPAAGEAGIATRSATLIPQSPESARLLLFSSNDFLGDQVLTAQVRATGTQYLGPLELLGNTLDWALQEELLQEIRSRGHFNRTLPPMQQSARWLLEALNYGAALAWLGLLGIYHVLRRRQQRRRYARELGL
jgi:ABC-2 type transport system permease protein